MVKILALVLFAAVVAFFGYQALDTPTESSPEEVTCTAEVKQCSDGSVVGRTGPSCSFAVCPGDTTTILPNTNTTDTNDVTTPAPVVGGKQIEVYNGISVSENVRTLDLSNRGLSGSLKAEIRMLSNLETLDISNNDFTGLPAEVGQLSRLRTLNLSNNPFTGLPNELGNLSNLEVLDLRGTQYAAQDLEVILRNLPGPVTVLTE